MTEDASEEEILEILAKSRLRNLGRDLVHPHRFRSFVSIEKFSYCWICDERESRWRGRNNFLDLSLPRSLVNNYEEARGSFNFGRWS